MLSFSFGKKISAIGLLLYSIFFVVQFIVYVANFWFSAYVYINTVGLIAASMLTSIGFIVMFLDERDVTDLFGVAVAGLYALDKIVELFSYITQAYYGEIYGDIPFLVLISIILALKLKACNDMLFFAVAALIFVYNLFCNSYSFILFSNLLNIPRIIGIILSLGTLLCCFASVLCCFRLEQMEDEV